MSFEVYDASRLVGDVFLLNFYFEHSSLTHDCTLTLLVVNILH